MSDSTVSKFVSAEPKNQYFTTRKYNKKPRIPKTKRCPICYSLHTEASFKIHVLSTFHKTKSTQEMWNNIFMAHV